MRRTTLTLALASATAVLSGCGTIANFANHKQDNPHIYGGVLWDVKAAQDWLTDRPLANETDLQRGAGTIVGTALMTADMFLSAIGDTLTLPITIPIALWASPVNPTNVSRKGPPPTAAKEPAPVPVPDGKPPG